MSEGVYRLVRLRLHSWTGRLSSTVHGMVLQRSPFQGKRHKILEGRTEEVSEEVSHPWHLKKRHDLIRPVDKDQSYEYTLSVVGIFSGVLGRMLVASFSVKHSISIAIRLPWVTEFNTTGGYISHPSDNICCEMPDSVFGPSVYRVMFFLLSSIALWPSATKFTVCSRHEVEASNCEF